MKKLRFIPVLLVALVCFSVSVNARKYTKFEYAQEDRIKITARSLNVRTGPGTEYDVLTTLKKGETVDVIGSMENWYVVHLPDNQVGVIAKHFTQVEEVKDGIATNDYDDKILVFNPIDTPDPASRMASLINQERVKNNLPPLIVDENLSKAAELKSMDMKFHNYLGHYSPTYGSLFQMLKHLGFVYQAAGENIITSISVEEAHTSFMHSDSHKIHILNPRYNKVGISVIEMNEKLKLIVQLFVEE